MKVIGWGGIFAVMLMRRFGRLPILFWSQVRAIVHLRVPNEAYFLEPKVLALGFLVGCTFAPNLNTFTGAFATPKV